jgi:hypothetical protein
VAVVLKIIYPNFHFFFHRFGVNDPFRVIILVVDEDKRVVVQVVAHEFGVGIVDINLVNEFSIGEVQFQFFNGLKAVVIPNRSSGVHVFMFYPGFHNTDTIKVSFPFSKKPTGQILIFGA